MSRHDIIKLDSLGRTLINHPDQYMSCEKSTETVNMKNEINVIIRSTIKVLS